MKSYKEHFGAVFVTWNIVMYISKLYSANVENRKKYKRTVKVVYGRFDGTPFHIRKMIIFLSLPLSSIPKRSLKSQT